MTGSPQCGGPHKRNRCGRMGVPDCTTGPAGRLRFVAHELAQRWCATVAERPNPRPSATHPARSER
jgi:hypothetical protein